MKNIRFLSVIILLAVSVGASGYLGYQTYALNKTKQSLENQLAQSRDKFVSSKTDLEAIIATVKQRLSDTESQPGQRRLPIWDPRRCCPGRGLTRPLAPPGTRPGVPCLS